MQIEFKEHVPLREWGSYKIGGPSRYFFEAHTAEELRAALAEAKRQKLPVFFLGRGTNLLISDKGFGGLVIVMEMRTLESDAIRVRVGAGVLVSDLLAFAIAGGLSGLEWAGGLPGTLGGAVRGNAGCFGGEMKDVVERVTSINIETLESRERNFEECRFGYRTSIFKELQGGEAVLEAGLRLSQGDGERIRLGTQEKIDYRNARHPMNTPNIGSIFKNVPVERVPEQLRQIVQSVVKRDPFPVVPTAYLISKAGMKGLRRGGAMVSPQHPNFIVNMGSATASDVEALIIEVKRAVKEKFNIELEEEVQRV